MRVKPRCGIEGEAESVGKQTCSDKIFDNCILLTKPELAKTLSVSVSFIDKLMSEESLPRVKLGRAVRFEGNRVLEWLTQRGYRK
jgi:excisionase family DNA binding protein